MFNDDGGMWGGQIELAVLSHALNRPIEVYREANAESNGYFFNGDDSRVAYVRDHVFGEEFTAESMEPIRVVFDGAHYDALAPKRTKTAPKTPSMQMPTDRIASPANLAYARAFTTTAKAQGETAPFGGLTGSKLVQTVLQSTRQRKYGQLVEGFPMPKGGKDHTATVIWLHGLGDSGFGWAPVSDSLAMPWVKFLFPTAPVEPVTLNGGFEVCIYACMYVCMYVCRCLRTRMHGCAVTRFD
jgi:hypothetical protein